MSKDKISLAEKDRMARAATAAKAAKKAVSMDETQSLVCYANGLVSCEDSRAILFEKLDAKYGGPDGFASWYSLRKDHVKPEGVHHNLKWLWDDLETIKAVLTEAVTAKGKDRDVANRGWTAMLTYGKRLREGGATRDPKPTRQVLREMASSAYRKIMRDDFATDEMADDAAVLFAMAVRYGANAAKLADISK